MVLYDLINFNSVNLKLKKKAHQTDIKKSPLEAVCFLIRLYHKSDVVNNNSMQKNDVVIDDATSGIKLVFDG